MSIRKSRDNVARPLLPAERSRSSILFFDSVQDAVVFFGLITLFGVLLLCFLIRPLFRKEIEYDLTNLNIAKEWRVWGDSRYTLTPQGVKVMGKGMFLLVSPGSESATHLGEFTRWQDLPYIEVQVDEGPSQRQGVLVWSPWGDFKKSLGKPFEIPPYVGKVVVDVRSYHPFVDPYRFKGLIGQFGLQLTGNVTVRRVILLSALPWWTQARQILSDFFTPELFFPSAINFQYGPTLSGVPVIWYLGGLVTLMALLMIGHTSRLTIRLFLGIAFACFLLLDMQFDRSLWIHCGESAKRSAFKDTRYEERASRFGKEFADLAKAFEENVPEGSKVFFPREKFFLVKGETNWISFHFYPQFQSVGLKEADYVFYYYPKRYVHGFGSVQSKTDSKEAIKVAIIHQVSGEAKVLKVNHD
jgi:hypothetical protein